MPTMVTEGFLLNVASLAEKRVTFSKEARFFRPKHVGCTIFSQKPCDGEQKLLLIIDLHINAHNGIKRVFSEKRVAFRKEA